MKKLLKIVLYSILAIITTCCIAFAVLFFLVNRDVKDQIQRGAIEKTIFSESPVYYDDGSTPIGVFFEKIHSKYIHYNDIPKIYIKALIASEDHNFFTHPGFDIRGIIRAAIANIKAGKIVQGGSTLSQQTAQNVFRREKRGFVSQLKELFRALILEHAYTKEEILEMYVNQFEVTGFGKGLRIASEYFFDKELKDLDLVETAFIAGMVNSPRKYDPFTKKTEEKKKQAMRYARIRKNSVLINMRKLNFITNEEYLDAKDREVPFKEGKVTYRLDVILDYIREQLGSEFFKKILHDQGVDNIATSGIRIYTSISKEMQNAAIESMRRNLPLLDIELSGYNKELFQERYLMKNGVIYRDQREGFPFFAEIKDIKRNNNPSITVAWDNNEEGVIDLNGIRPMAEAWLSWKLGNSAQLRDVDITEFLKLFKEGDSIPVLASNDNTPDKGLTLWEIPELDGGVVVMKSGMIKAMVGGFFNRYFNRAADARRQLGSIFKPLVYAAALQLKWHELDELMDMPGQFFTFTNALYPPRPDHPPKSDKVSMIWAGVKSENIATVWLLYHLTDRLNLSEFRQIAEKVGLTRGVDESYNDYVHRIRDTQGIIVNMEALRRAAFEEAKKSIEADLIFGGYEAALENIDQLHLSLDISRYDPDEYDDLDIMKYDFNRLRAMNSRMKEKLKDLQTVLTLYRTDVQAINDKIGVGLKHLFEDRTGAVPGRIIYTETPEKINRVSYKEILPEDLRNNQIEIDLANIWIDNLVPSEVIDLLQSHINDHLDELTAFSRYDMNVLSKIRDFRTLVNLFYVKQLAHDMGISTWLDPVLSFPLGPNSISILEAALAYQTIMTGSRYPLEQKMIDSEMVPIITRIEDRDGITIWEYKQGPEKVLSKRVSATLSEILRMVIQEGTGRRAKKSVRMSIKFESGEIDLPVPCFGKTGTANRFTNSSFIGFIPGLNKESGEFDINKGYVIASYVGYDNNFPMKGPNISIAGSSGALPIWIDTSGGVVNSPEYQRGFSMADLAFLDEPGPLLADKNLTAVMVSPISGLRVEENSSDVPLDETIETYSYFIKDGPLKIPEREFDPIKGVQNE